MTNSARRTRRWRVYWVRGCYAITQALHWPIRAFVQWLDLKLATYSQHMGLHIYRAALGREELGRTLDCETVKRAVAILGSLEPRRLRRLSSDVHQILLIPQDRSEYRRESKTLILAAPAEQDLLAAIVAGDLVHEGVHARLDKVGIRMWPDLRLRIERRCTLEQILFLEKVPGSELIVAHYKTWLQRIGE